jgi:hypothetical protein
MNLINNSNVIPHPGLRYAEIFQELETNLWAEQLVKCLYALQNNFGREPIARFNINTANTTTDILIADIPQMAFRGSPLCRGLQEFPRGWSATAA